jgi:8-oxo-dGTP diphosphatase
MESFEDCAVRETREEAGIEIKNIKFLYLSNVTEYAPKHYVHIGLVADWAKGEPTTMEPEKAEDWKWHSPDQLPRPLFKMCELSFKAYKEGKDYL